MVKQLEIVTVSPLGKNYFVDRGKMELRHVENPNDTIKLKEEDIQYLDEMGEK